MTAASLVVFSYPLVFAVERGNIEVFICLLVAGGLFSAWRGNLLVAALLLGLAATAKPFPLLFFGIFITRPIRWRPLLLAIATTTCGTWMCLWSAGPTVIEAAKGFYAGMVNIEHNRAATTFDGGLMFDHSLFSPLKAISLHQHVSVASTLHLYFACLAVALLWGAWRVSHYPLLNRICFYTVAAVAASPISYEYTLLDAFPLLVLITAECFRLEQQRRGGWMEMSALALTLCLFYRLRFTATAAPRLGARSTPCYSVSC